MAGWNNFFVAEVGASATLFSFCFAFVDAWVLLIEINR